MAKENLHIEYLDSGFVITHKGKRSVAVNSAEVEKVIIEKLKDLLKLHRQGIYSASISLEFKENPPQQAKSN